MSTQLPLTIVFGFRDRDTERVERCLTSLQQQTFQDFEVIFVDYGSSMPVAAAVKSVVEQHDFCRYIYSDTRGYPWNRSRVLNIGGRLATSSYLMTSDVDMVFPTDFLSILIAHADAGQILYCYPHFLPKGFNQWVELDAFYGKLPVGSHYSKGGCQVVSTEVFQQIRGFDEYFQYWGTEDTDINHRLKAAGLEEVWLTDHTYMFHQWHPEVNYKTAGFMPDGLWGRMENYRHRNRDQIVRNSADWGHIHTSEERVALTFIDLDTAKLANREDLVLFNRQPSSNREAGNMVSQFWELPAGHALAVDHALYPCRTRLLDGLIRGVNKVAREMGLQTQIDYSSNLLHSSLVEFIQDSEDIIADYFLGLPTLNGVSVIVKA